jgi:DNA methylase
VIDVKCELRLGRWQDALANVGEVDALICDPPYSARTDKGYRSETDFAAMRANALTARASQDALARASGRKRQPGRAMAPGNEAVTKSRFELPYAPITEEWARAFISYWYPRVKSWFVVFGDHVSNRWFESAMSDMGLVTFAPVPWVRTNSAPRFAADGPANSCEWIAIARPKGLPGVRGSRPGWYEGPIARSGFVAGGNDERVVTGGKPLWLMRSLVRDYSRPGDLIVDPCAGGATTLIAARMEGRRAIGAEMDQKTHALASKRLAKPYTPNLFQEELRSKSGAEEQCDLLGWAP